MTPRIVVLLAAGTALGMTHAPLLGEQVQTPVPAGEASSPRSVRPFVVGERAEYEIKLMGLTVGTGTMELRGIDTVRDRDAYHFAFTISARAAWPINYSIRDTLQSWTDTADFNSLRFHQDQYEGFGHNDPRRKRYEIFPDRQKFEEPGKPAQPSVADPLDDASFLYFVRTQNLEVGKTYPYDRYFKPNANPVTVHVIKKDTIRVPAGEFVTLKLKPIIKTSGLFSEGGEAFVWITDDSARLVVQITTKLAHISQLTLRLKTYRPSFAAPPPRHP